MLESVPAPESQKSAGLVPERLSSHKGDKAFHTYFGNDKWWTAFMPKDMTPKELLDFARSIEADMLRHYPDLS